MPVPGVAGPLSARSVSSDRAAIRGRGTRRGPGEVTIGDRPRAGFAGQTAEGEVADGGLIPLADQFEHTHALRDVVVRLVGAALRRVQQAAHAQELAPRAGRRARVDAAFDRRQARVGFLRPLREHEGLGGDEFGVEAFAAARLPRR
jgi:hypothetical protein